MSTAKLQSYLLAQTGLALMLAGRWSDFSNLMGAFDTSEQDEIVALFWLLFRAFEYSFDRGERIKAREHVDAMRATDPESMGPEEIVAFAEAVYRSDGDADFAHELLARVAAADTSATDLNPFIENLQPFDQRLGLNRLLYALGGRRTTIGYCSRHGQLYGCLYRSISNAPFVKSPNSGVKRGLARPSTRIRSMFYLGT